MKHLLRILLFLPFFHAFAADPQVRLELVPQDGIFRMYPQAANRSAKTVRIALHAAGKSTAGRDILVQLTALDIFRKPVEWRQELRLKLPAEGATVTNTVEFQAGQGFFQVFATCQADGQACEACTGIGIISPHHRGVRPDSFFASNTSSVRTGLQLRFLQAIGMKVQRTHLNPVIAEIPERPQGACQLNPTAMDRAWQDCLDHDTWILPIVGYNFGERMRSDLARRTDMHGPPRDLREFVDTWETIVRRYPRITTWEFWNEPWIYGWTWAAEPEMYRQFQREWCRMALSVNPAMRIVAGNSSMFTEDHIEPYPDSWKGLLQGTSHHPYSGVSDATFRISGQGRSLDQGGVVIRRAAAHPPVGRGHLAAHRVSDHRPAGRGAGAGRPSADRTRRSRSVDGLRNGHPAGGTEVVRSRSRPIALRLQSREQRSGLAPAMGLGGGRLRLLDRLRLVQPELGIGAALPDFLRN